MTAQQVAEIQEAWGVPQLPAVYVDFLTHMGFGAGRVLRGTDAFFPAVRQMKKWGDDFFHENSGISRPGEAVVFAMHQGYLVYWMSDISSPDPEVVLCAEGDPSPSRVWPSFTAFLNSHYEDEPGVK
ncbi:SMI1/KNR4 family protein [Catenuloplanes indicus]|uniref:Knr4/Smi1-like domain-containing protein n=1 Tax=Catenuloplanes indicus TaxID=137267 RepID=A0AAE3W4X3_9ACTN|nr:SMI1/KNR4 family protein [Catenuloplanes indicus]MDQ0369372.1 hypothetical protein [Catenuloplanes indicus]